MMVEQSQKLEPVPAKPSASIILLRDSEEGVELFVVRRNANMRFAAGATAFPGGALDQQDIDFANKLNADDEILPFRINAIRELFEETGMLFASRLPGKLLPASELKELDPYRPLLVNQTLSFEQFLADQQLQIESDGLVHFAKWIPPEMLKRRFVTDFFLARQPAGQHYDYDKGELDSAYWCPLSRLMEKNETGEVTLMFPTEMNCLRLMQQSTVDEIMSAACQPAPTIKTITKQTDEGLWLCTPEEAGVGNIMRLLPGP